MASNTPDVAATPAAMPVEPHEKVRNVMGRIFEHTQVIADREGSPRAIEYRDSTILEIGSAALMDESSCPADLEGLPAEEVVTLFNGLSRRVEVAQRLIELGYRLVPGKQRTVWGYAANMLREVFDVHKWEAPSALQETWSSLFESQKVAGFDEDAEVTRTAMEETGSWLDLIKRIKAKKGALTGEDLAALEALRASQKAR